MSRSGSARTIALAAASAALAAACGGGEVLPTPAEITAAIETAQDCQALIGHFESLVAVAVHRLEDVTPEDLDIVDLADWKPRVVVFLHDDADLEAVAAEASVIPGVLDVATMTKDDALVEAREIFAEDPGMLAVIEDDPSVLPASVRLDVEEGMVDVVAEAAEGLPGMWRLESTPHRDVLVWNVSMAALGATDLSTMLAALDERANDLGCDLGDLADQADLSAIDAAGPLAEIVLEAARTGFTP